MADRDAPTPDLTAGVSADSIPDGSTLVGKVGKKDVLLVRTGGRLFAVGAHCTHYHGALSEGLVVGETIRCPLHHASFNLATGEAVRAPALDPIGCWRVDQRDGKVFVSERADSAPAAARQSSAGPASNSKKRSE